METIFSDQKQFIASQWHDMVFFIISIRDLDFRSIGIIILMYVKTRG